MFVTALFIKAKLKNDPNYLSTGKWINEMAYIHRKEHSSATKSNDIAMRATTWMNLKNITLNDRRHTRKTPYISHDPIYIKYPGKTESENRSAVSAWGELQKNSRKSGREGWGGVLWKYSKTKLW